MEKICSLEDEYKSMKKLMSDVEWEDCDFDIVGNDIIKKHPHLLCSR